MKNMRKLIPAVAMLMVAAIMMSTASFAWFSMNSTVTATGMSVTANAPSSLLISTTSATSGFGSTVTLQDTTIESSIAPCHYNTTMAFAKLNGTGVNFVNEAGATTGAAKSEMDAFIAGSTPASGTYIVATENDYYTDEVWLKYEGEKDASATITVTVKYAAGTYDAIKGAMHIVLVDNKTGTKYDYDMTKENTALDLGTLSANDTEGTQYTVYYFLDGEDAECKNSNIKTTNALSVTLTFGIK